MGTRIGRRPRAGTRAVAACLLLAAIPLTSALPLGTAPWGAWSVETVALADSVVTLEGEGGVALDGFGAPHILAVLSPTRGTHYSKVAGPSWSSESFEPFSTFGSPATDSDGVVHGTIHTQGRTILSLVTWTSDGTSREVVDTLASGDEIRTSAIHFDAAGREHITYGTAGGSLKYATRTAPGPWTIETVTTGHFHKSAVDKLGGVHVAFERSNRVDYAFRTPAGGWTIQQVPTCYWYVSVAADSQGHPHIACQNLTKGLVYTRHTGAQWVEEVLVNSLATTRHTVANIGYESDIALDSEDRPHITFHNRNTFSSFDPTRGGSLTYATKTGSGWVFEELDRLDGNTGAVSSIVVDDFDRPHLSYLRISYGNSVPCLPGSLTCFDLKYATPVVAVPNDHGLGLV